MTGYEVDVTFAVDKEGFQILGQNPDGSVRIKVQGAEQSQEIAKPPQTHANQAHRHDGGGGQPPPSEGAVHLSWDESGRILRSVEHNQSGGGNTANSVAANIQNMLEGIVKSLNDRNPDPADNVALNPYLIPRIGVSTTSSTLSSTPGNPSLTPLNFQFNSAPRTTNLPVSQFMQVNLGTFTAPGATLSSTAPLLANDRDVATATGGKTFAAKAINDTFYDGPFDSLFPLAA